VNRFPVRRAAAPVLSAASLLLALSLAVSALAADTQWWILDSPGDYARSEARGVVVRPDGSLELGPEYASATLDSVTVVWALARLADGSVAIACDQGRVLRRDANGHVRPWARLGEGQVLSLLADGDGVLAGTGPDGAIYRIGAKGDTTLVARTGERYVWGLAPAGHAAWYAATGTRGRLLRVEGGRTRVLLDTDESNLVSLLADGRGGAYAGGDSRGRVVHVAADGAARTVFDASEDEVRGLALGADGALYAAALSAGATPAPDDKDEPGPARSAPPSTRAVVYRIVPDSSTTAVWTAPQPFVFALAGPAARTGKGAAAEGPGLFAATGNRAAVYRLDAPAGATQWLAMPEGQVTALAPGVRGELFAATSNPAALWTLGPGPARRGELLSMALDARRIARFGHILWQGDAGGGRVALATRSGNTDDPDTTWSPWADAPLANGGGAIASPPARYLQWRVTLEGGRPRIESVENAWREQNQPPQVADVLVAPQGQGFREGELQPRLDPVTQVLPGGQRVEYSTPSATTPRQMRDLPAWARGLRTVQWRASDPNGDPLRFTVEVRSEPAGAWLPVAQDLEEPGYTWDTAVLPDGRYRLRVTATDEAGNAVGEGRVVAALSQPFTVDNTPPVVDALEARGLADGTLEVRGHAADRGSALQRIEVAVDDGAWRPITPEGGITDRPEHGFTAHIPAVASGTHALSVRVVDLAGNSALRALQVVVR
jgi:hypothetical protein